MSRIFVLMGAQGAGKGTQAKMAAERFGLPIVATGDLLREAAARDTELGRVVRGVLESGELVSDEILAGVVAERTARKDCADGYILDGFPRTLPQAELLDQLATNQKKEIRAIEIAVPRDLLYKRLSGRRTCGKCGRIYNIYFQPPRDDEVCDECGQQLFKRSDDNNEAIARRLSLYDEKTSPILDYYERSGRLVRVDGTGKPEEVFLRVAAAME